MSLNFVLDSQTGDKSTLVVVTICRSTDTNTLHMLQEWRAFGSVFNNRHFLYTVDIERERENMLHIKVQSGQDIAL